MRTFFSVFLTLAFLLAPAARSMELPKHRSVVLDYDYVIKDIPEGASIVKIWAPYPSQTPYQKIKEESPGGWQPKITRDKKYGNKIAYYSIESPESSSIEINMRYNVERYEYSNHPDPASPGKITYSDQELKKYLLPNKLVTLSPRVKKLASEITGDKSTVVEKARAIYDYVFENFTYDKITPGWGNGDTERACDLKKGNCTDFHSVFISLSRASNIPARFVIGIPFPKSGKSKSKSYHCWAEFYVAGTGWIPVDISEAWKDRSKYEYHFGTVDSSRIEFSKGRDIILEPSQEGEPLNYFIYPYVEVDGKPYRNVDVVFGIRVKERS
ncbi:MAG: transglutaminase-like domain-containing protein [Omnitrophica bacterium]|nr:transglutaminase-like domain-containing protein [Candidatus Omnitrophota bacterium]